MKTGWKNFAPEAVGIIFIIILTVLVYRPTLNGGWNFDDLGHIVNNPAVHLDTLSPSSLVRAATGPLKNRPLSYLSFAIDYHREGFTFEARAFHLTNLVIHLLATLAAWLFLRALLAAPTLGVPHPQVAALFGAAVFALHPVQFQSAAYVVQRMNLLAGLFIMTALAFWLYGRERQGRGRLGFFIAAGISALLGLASKETTAALALLLPVVDLCLSGSSLREWALRRKAWLAGLATVAVIGGAVLFIGGNGLAGYKDRDFTPAERLLTQPRVVLWYAGLWFFPAPGRLSLEHEFPVSRSLFSPASTLPALVVVIILTGLALFYSRRAPLLCLGWQWFIFGLALESSILPLEMVFEHRLYSPGLGLYLCSLDLYRRVRPGRAHAAAAAAVLAALVWSASVRAYHWENDRAVWRDAVSKAPGLSRPWSNLCAVDFSWNDPEGAATACRQAVRVGPKDPNGHFNLGLARLAVGEFEPAAESFSRAIELRPGWAEAFYQRGRAWARTGRFEEAEADLTEATRLVPTDPVYWQQFAVVLIARNKIELGREAIQRARENLINSDANARAGLERALRSLEDQANRAP